MLSTLADALKNAPSNIKNTVELDKHMRNLSAYKSPKPSNL